MNFVGVSPAAVAAGDLNGDGIPDVVTVNQGSSDVSDRKSTRLNFSH